MPEENKFVTEPGDFVKMPQGFKRIVRDVIEPQSMKGLYAVVTATGDAVGDIVLEREEVIVMAATDRRIGDMMNQPSLIFRSADLDLRHADLEDEGVSSMIDDYEPYIPNAFLWNGEMRLGPERIL